MHNSPPRAVIIALGACPLMSYAIPLFPSAFTGIINLRAYTNGVYRLAYMRRVNDTGSARRKIYTTRAGYHIVKGHSKTQPRAAAASTPAHPGTI